MCAASHMSLRPYGKEYESENVGVRFISAGYCAEPANKPKEIRLKNPIETGRINPTPTRIRGRQAKFQ